MNAAPGASPASSHALGAKRGHQVPGVSASVKKNSPDRLASDPHLPNVKATPAATRARHGEGTFTMPSAIEVREAMRNVPEDRQHDKRYVVEGFNQKLVGF